MEQRGVRQGGGASERGGERERLVEEAIKGMAGGGREGRITTSHYGGPWAAPP